MNQISPYDEALHFIKKNPGTGGAGSLAKLVLSLYNSMCGYSFAECVSNLDDQLTSLALRMVKDYASRGETDDLREAGKVIADDLYPGLWEMAVAMHHAREETRNKWRREEEAREAARIADAEKACISKANLHPIPITAVEEMLRSDDGKVSASYRLYGQWSEKRLPVDQVLTAIRENGTAFIAHPDSSGTLGVRLDGYFYYVYTDYDARERYLENSSK